MTRSVRSGRLAVSLAALLGALALLFPVGAAGVMMKDEAQEFDFAKLGVPRYPGLAFLVGTAPKEAQTRVGPEGEEKTPGPAASMTLYVYSTADTIEQVVDFYEKKLGQKAHWGKPKDLAQKFPFHEIPERSKGRQATFVVKDPPKPGEPRTSGAGLLGKAHIVVSDFCMDPQLEALVAKTTVMFVELKADLAQELGPPPSLPGPWPPGPSMPIEPPPPKMPGGAKP